MVVGQRFVDLVPHADDFLDLTSPHHTSVSNPRRVLAVSLESQAVHLSAFVDELTGQTPTPVAGAAEPSLAGTTHDLHLKTRYYTATVPVWLDLIAVEDPDAAARTTTKATTTSTEVPGAGGSTTTTTGAADWAASFLSEEAREVLAVLGGVVVVFAVPPRSAAASTVTASTSVATSVSAASTASEATAGAQRKTGAPSPYGSASASPDTAQQVKELIHHVGRVLGEGLGGWEWDGVRIAVGVGGPPATVPDDGFHDDAADEWDELCAEAGMEFVHVPAWSASSAASARSGRNEFGEKTGMARVREALEANDWEGAGGGEDEFGAFEGSRRSAEDDDDGAEAHELDPESLDFGFDRADFEGLKRAIWSAGREHGEDDDGAGDAADGRTQTRAAQTGRAEPRPGEDAVDNAADDRDAHEQEALDDDDVAKVERMMRKLQAAREAGETMGDAQRRRMAAKAVAEVMREL
ncbi:alpha and gamma adaptin binding protein p34 [Purpureocillium lavendulum]|uniref:Alpha and gamma adaptin binding protein p34 n=1 Tax=Purpureocillium lavendulum TaxID=1247861 RepID=A0AB34FMT6_9HYPO|nr:alpha and gamma adaptin binding protein p34 [Purpureocillium lavendulum]